MRKSQNSNEEIAKNNKQHFSNKLMDQEKNVEIDQIRKESEIKKDLVLTDIQLSGSTELELINNFDKININDNETIGDKINTPKDHDFCDRCAELGEKLRKENDDLKEEIRTIKKAFNYMLKVYNNEEYVDYLQKKADRLDMIFDMFPDIKKMFSEKEKGEKAEEKYPMTAKNTTLNSAGEEKEDEKMEDILKKENDKK